MSAFRVLTLAASLSLGVSPSTEAAAIGSPQSGQATVSTRPSGEAQASTATEYDGLLSVRRISERAIVVAVAGGERLAGALAAVRGVIPRLEAQLQTLDATSEQAVRQRSMVLYYKAVLEGLSTGFTLTLPSMTFPDRTVLDMGDRRLEKGGDRP